MALAAKPGAAVFARNVYDFFYLGLVLVIGFTLNVVVMGAIVVRLWWMGRKVNGIKSTLSWGSHGVNKYTATIFVIAESGAIYDASSLTLAVLCCTRNIAAATALDAVPQLAVRQGNISRFTHKIS